MPRSIWSGTVSFGLVNVPVKLYAAVSPKTVRFHQLEQSTGARIRQRRVSSLTGEEVPYEEIVKGYEIGPDRYVAVTPEELDALDPQATHTIEIEEFVDAADIDPVYYDHPYYLVPGTGAAKAYRLLLEAMRDTGRVAIGRVVLRSKQQLCAIRATGDALAMSTMNYGDEVVPPENLDELGAAGEVQASERELSMARQLIESLSGEWDPGRHRDEYREQVLELIERKAAGEEVAVAPAAPAPQPVPDLMAALEASLAAVRAEDGGDGARESGARRRGSRSRRGDEAREPAAEGGSRRKSSKK